MEIFFIENYQELTNVIASGKKFVVITQLSAEYCSPCNVVYNYMKINFKTLCAEFFNNHPFNCNLIYYYNDIEKENNLVSDDEKMLIRNIPSFFVYKISDKKIERQSIIKAGSQIALNKVEFFKLLEEISKF
jgi:hypothetical protein